MVGGDAGPPRAGFPAPPTVLHAVVTVRGAAAIASSPGGNAWFGTATIAPGSYWLEVTATGRPALDTPPEPRGRIRRPSGGPGGWWNGTRGCCRHLPSWSTRRTGAPRPWSCKSSRQLADALGAQAAGRQRVHRDHLIASRDLGRVAGMHGDVLVQPGHPVTPSAIRSAARAHCRPSRPSSSGSPDGSGLRRSVSLSRS
jgi:hypothetical protein